jgi:hypothetical protein
MRKDRIKYTTYPLGRVFRYSTLKHIYESIKVIGIRGYRHYRRSADRKQRIGIEAGCQRQSKLGEKENAQSSEELNTPIWLFAYPFLVGIGVGVSLPGVTSGRSGITGFSSGIGSTSGAVDGCCGISCGISGISFVAIGMN